jgi:hypothetical protein
VVPSSLVGDWVYGRAEPGVTQQARTEFFSGGSTLYVGVAHAALSVWSFARDGQVTAYAYDYRGVGACVLRTWKEVHGTATFGATAAGDSAFTLAPTSGRYKVHERCATDVLADYDRPMTPAELAGEARTHAWRWETNPNDGRTYLFVGYGADRWLHFRRDQ